MKLLIAMHDAKAALYAGLGRETFASLAGDFEKGAFLIERLVCHTASGLWVVVVER